MEIDARIVIDCCEDVYAPAEDTYLMIESLSIDEGENVLEIGCGTGIISLHCARNGAKVTASDISDKAVECAIMNARKNDIDIIVLNSDLFEEVNDKFDLIIFNPPYLPADNVIDITFSGGDSGVEISIEFLSQCGAYLRRGGRAVLIISSLSDFDKFKSAADELDFSIRKLAEKPLFFERITVYELRLKK